MTSVMRAFAIIGVAMVGAMVHSWIVPVTVAAEGNEMTAEQRLKQMRQAEAGAPDDPAQDPSGDAQSDTNRQGGDEPVTREDPPVDPQIGGLDPDGVTDPTLHIPLSLVRELYADHVEQMTGEVALIDARGAEGVYEEGHIWGAQHITSDMLQDGTNMDALAAVQMMLPDQWIIIYCGGGDCDESENLRTLLVEYFEMTNVWIFEAGYPALDQAGLPTVTGSSPIGQ